MKVHTLADNVFGQGEADRTITALSSRIDADEPVAELLGARP